MANKDIGIVLAGYQMLDKESNVVEINAADEFKIYIDGNEQDIETSYYPSTDAGPTSFIFISQTPDFGVLTIKVKPDALDYFLTATSDGTTILESNEIPDTGASFGTPDLFNQDYISPDFVYIIIPGCSLNEPGPFPDVYGFCRPDGDNIRLPNEFGYCKDPGAFLQPNTGYNVCNFDPEANDDSNADCVYTANGEVGSVELPFSAEQDDTYCDCFGHTLDCNNTCISNHDTGECSPENTSISGALYPNGEGCFIETCDDGDYECINPDAWMNYYDNVQNGIDQDEQCERYFCDGVAQGIGHPLIGTVYMDDTGYTTFNCGLGQCLDCNGQCSSSDQVSDDEGTICGECIGGTTTAAIDDCAPPWENMADYDNGNTWICIDGWSKDCFGNCPGDAGHAGGCGQPSLLTDYGDGVYSPLIETILIQNSMDGACGIGCDGVCGSEKIFDECGVCGGDGIPADQCDCDGNIVDCNGVCNGPLLGTGVDEIGNDECGICGGDGIPEGECSCNSINGTDTTGDGNPDDFTPHILDCNDECNGTAVLDDCGECSGGSSGNTGYFFTLPDGTPCQQYTSIDCLIDNTWCSCGALYAGGDGEVWDCRAENAYLLPGPEEIAELEASCGGGSTNDACGTCGGSCNTCACGCNEVNLDACNVCGGGVDILYDCSGGLDDFGLPCTNTPGSCNTPVDTCDTCGVCGGPGYGTSNFPEIEYNGIFIEARTGVPNCDCEGTPAQLWCYDGDQNGVGCYDCSTSPQYSCNNPGGTEFSSYYVGSGANVTIDAGLMDEFCSQSTLDEICDSSYDECGDCGGSKNTQICPNGSADEYCCNTSYGDDNYLVCDCNNECSNIPPAANLGFDASGNLDENGYYDCNGECRGTAILDFCNNCCCGGILCDTVGTETEVPCGYEEGACDCEGNVYDCTYPADGSCGGDAELDFCGICEGDCTQYSTDSSWSPCGDQNDCGTCFSDWNPVTCDTTNPQNTLNQICDCENNVCDDCGVCGGDGAQEYYYDQDGDGIVCDVGSSFFCDGDPNLELLCGIGEGSLCWVAADGFGGSFESYSDNNNLCDCPFEFDNCGRGVELDGSDVLIFENQQECQVVNGVRLPDCPTEQDPGMGTTCNSKYCAYYNYECRQECDGGYYIYEQIPEWGTADYIAPILQPGDLGERPQYDACGECRKPGCSNYLDEIPEDQPNWTNEEVYGNEPICNPLTTDQDNPVPTNLSWNTTCVDCAGTVNGYSIPTCDFINYSTTPSECVGGPAAICNGVCNGTSYTCSPIYLYPGHAHANLDTDGDGVLDSIDFNCDGGDCLDTCGDDPQCRPIPHVIQLNKHNESCGCGEPDTLTEENGCCLGGVLDCALNCSESTYWIGDGDFTPDSGRDCAGVCQGDAREEICCDTVQYCFGDDGVVDGTSCLDVAACGCYSDPTACNYNPTDSDNVADFLGGKNTYELGEYACVDASSDGYYTIGDNGFAGSGIPNSNFVELCGSDFGFEVEDCCDCVGNVLDCDYSCGGNNIRKQYYHDYDCDGLGSGDLTTNYFCSNELPVTNGCWSLTLNEDELGDFCRTDIVWDSGTYPSTEVDGRMIPNETFACQAKESFGGTDGDFEEYCRAIQDVDVCLNDEFTPECKWEQDFFYGIDDCGNCFRDIDGNINPAFNVFGESSQDCNGCCDYGSNSGCGSPYENGICEDGSDTCDFNGTITQDFEGNNQYPGLDQCGDCNGNGQRCAGCIFVGANNGPGTDSQGCTDADGNSMDCLFDCSANYPDQSGMETACCEFDADCLGNVPTDDDWIQFGPAVIDFCGVCTGGSTQLTPNFLQQCGCCPPNTGSWYDGYQLGHINDDVDYTHYGLCTDGIDTDGDGQIDYYTIEEWIDFKGYEGSGLWTTDNYPNFEQCNGGCFGDDFIDSCGLCQDPDDAYVIVDFPGYNYSQTWSGGFPVCDCDGTTPLYWDDCGGCGENQFNMPNVANNQCSCSENGPLKWDECGNCDGDAFETNCIMSNICNDMDCNGQCGGSATYDNHANVGPQCCLPTERDECGVCFGENENKGCDDICFSGNEDQDCGCGTPGELGVVKHCFDDDGDGLGDPFFQQNICPLGTPFEGLVPSFGQYYSLPDNYTPTGGGQDPNKVETWTTDCNDPEPDCPGTTDTCGQCEGTDVVCYGCNIPEACNYGMRKDGNGACTTIPCTFAENSMCIMPTECGDETCNANDTYCPPTATINGTEDVPICNGNWGDCYEEVCQVEIDCPANGCENNQPTYCPGQIQEQECWYPDDCGLCVEGNINNNVGGSWTCNDCLVPSDTACSTCACTGCNDDTCGSGYDGPNLYPVNPTYETTENSDAFCPMKDCNNDCNGTAVVDECDTCTGGNTGNDYNDGIDSLYPCGCDDRTLYDSNEDCPTDADGNIVSPCYCNDCDSADPDCVPSGCDNNEWKGCPTCGSEPDECGNCYEDGYGGYGVPNLACTICVDETACNYTNIDELPPEEPYYINNESCRWVDIENNCSCTGPWTNNDEHNNWCQSGNYIDECGEVYQDLDDPNFNNCVGCMTEGAINYNPVLEDEEDAGTCFFGDMVMIPSSGIGSGLDYYVFRPAGNDTTGTLCIDGENDYSTCNENYGGIESIEPDNSQNQISAYKLEIFDSSNNSLKYWWATSSYHYFSHPDYNNEGSGNDSNSNPDCPILLNDENIDGAFNIHTFVSCGVGYRFIKNDNYRIELTIYDLDGSSTTLENTLNIGNSIDWEVSLSNYQQPYQGQWINNPFTDEFRYRKQDFEPTFNGGFDTDGRPSLGTFYYSDDPNNFRLLDRNLGTDGYIDNYFYEDFTMSGKKWGGLGGIGKKFDGLVKNVENECGVDLKAFDNENDLSDNPENNTSNNGCLITENYEQWLPDVLTYTQRSLTGENSRLWEYYDPILQPIKYQETTAPSEVIFHFQPTKYGSNPWQNSREIAQSMSDNIPMYLLQLDWGDGEIEYETEAYELNKNQELRHTYSKPGVYEITGYWFSIHKGRTCVDIHGEHDGRNWACTNDNHCVGFCSDIDNGGVCIGGSESGLSCSTHEQCHNTLNQIDDSKNIKCQPADTEAKNLHDFGVNRFFKFTTKININEPEGYSEHPYILNQTNTNQAVIGGISKKGIYYKNILRQLGYFSDIPEEEPLDLQFLFHYDMIMTQYALAQMDENFIADELNAFMTPVYDAFDGTLIYSGKYNRFNGELGKSFGNLDLGQVRYFNESISMAEMLGFNDEYGGDPKLETYWKNIIPQNYFIGDRTGLEYNEDDLISVNASDTDGQIWIGQNEYGNNYYYPVLPKLNVYGEFDEENLGLQGDRIPFGHEERESWNAIDDKSLITSVMSNDFNKYLLLDIGFDSESDGMLQDLSGNGNDGFIYNDYRIDYEQETRVPEKVETQIKPELDQDGKQF